MSFNEDKGTNELSNKVDIVIVWHDKWQADIFVGLIREKHSKKVDVYYSCDSFLQEFKKYPKDTKICFNYTLENGKTAPQIAEVIYEEGYTNVFCITAYDPEYLKKYGNIPDYLTVLFKDNIERAIRTLLR
jgi:hypothetical protein